MTTSWPRRTNSSVNIVPTVPRPPVISSLKSKSSASQELFAWKVSKVARPDQVAAVRGLLASTS